MTEAVPKTVAASFAAASERITKRSLLEWEAMWQARRIRAFKDRKLRGTTLYTISEVNDAVRFYDLDYSDFQATVSDDGVPSMMAHDVDRTKFERAAGPELVRVVRYRLTQECLNRIAREAG